MGVWITLLRGVNVGGHNKLPMAEFRLLLTSLGYENPRTYIQSGNAVFESGDMAAKISGDVSVGIEDQFGFRPSVMVRSAADFVAAIASNPFPQAVAEPTQLHLFFLSECPDQLDRDALQAKATKGEEFHLAGDVFYLYTPNGFGRSDLAGKLPSLIKIPMTGRNLRSCIKVSELAGVA